MAQQILGTAWDRVYRVSDNSNFTELYNTVTKIYNTMNDLVLESGTSNMEVVQARGGEPTLNARLDKIDQDVYTLGFETNLQLAEKANQSDLDIANQLIDKKVFQTDFMERNTEVDASINSIKDELKGVTFAGLTKPFYMSHRGALNIFPESSVEAYRGCFDLGEKVLEMDVRLTTDGALVIQHDDTMERTTDKTIDMQYASSMGFKSAKIDNLHGWSGTPALLEDLFREFGNKVIYAIEMKDRLTTNILVDTIIKYNLQDNVLVQSFSAPDLDYARSKNLPVLYARSTEDITPDTILGWGITRMGIGTHMSDTYIQSAIDLGMDVFMYTVNRRHEHDKYLAMGVAGFFSDDPLWIQRKSPVTEWDTFRDQVFTHGQSTPDKGTYIGGDRGTFVAPTQFGWTSSSEITDFTMMGWAGEMPGYATIRATMHIKQPVSSVRWGAIAFCTPNDFFADTGSYGNLSDGYNLLLRESGMIELYKRVDDVATKLGEVSSPALPNASYITVQIAYNSTRILVTRTDSGGAGENFLSNDTEFRGGYLHVGRRYTGVTFSNIGIS